MTFLLPDGTVKNEANDPIWQKMIEKSPVVFTRMDEYIQNLGIYVDDAASPKGHYSYTPAGSLFYSLLRT